jgi:serine/threonine protein kinase/Flp pilus assembly protein TadD
VKDTPTIHGHVSVARRVDQVCDRFEAAWRSGECPRIEDFVSSLPERELQALLRELIPLEIDYRLRGGARPTPAEYLARFPAEAELIQALFQEGSRVPEPGTSAGPQVIRLEPTLLEGPVAGASGLWGPVAGASGLCDPVAGASGLCRGRAPVIAGHEVLGVLGRGAMGVVYKARQVALNRLVALKMILAGSQASPEDRDRFRDEAWAVARLQHPNIVQIHDIGEQDGLPFLTLEFVPGGSLADRLRQTTLAPREAAELVETLARAVHVAHQRGIVHRDLKPANVLLTADGVPKITDFGLAKFIGADSILTHQEGAGHTQTGAIIGTPSYMAPEQASGQPKEIGPPADIHALGAILYEVLTGRPPFRGAGILETLEQVRNQDPLPPRRLKPSLPRDLETICLKCLHKTPAQRYTSALALADDLRRFVNYEPIQARRTPLSRRLFRSARRRPLVTAFVLFMLALLLAAGGVVRSAMIREQERLQATLNTRKEFLSLVTSGSEAVSRQDWPSAKLQWQRALDRIGADAVEGDLSAQVEQVRVDLEELRRAREGHERFCAWRERAMTHEALLLGLGVADRQQSSASALRAAQRLFSDEGEFLTSLPRRYLSESEKREIDEGNYQRLLLLAEIVAGPEQGPPDQAVKALAIMDQAARLARDSPVEHLRHGRDRAYHLQRASYLERRGWTDAAHQERELAASTEPDNALAFWLLGQEYLHRGQQVQRAIGEFEKALRLQPNHFWAQYSLALCYLKRGNLHPDLARAHLTACLSQSPDSPWIRLLVGFTSCELGDFEAAAAAYQQVEAHQLDDLVHHVLLVNRGVLYLRQADTANLPIGALDAAVVLGPGSLHPHVGLALLGRHLCQQGFLAGAISDFEDARTLRPEEWMVCVNLSGAFLRQQRPAQAQAQLDQAIGLAPREARLYRERARVHLCLGNLSAARNDMKKAIGLQPADEPARERALDLVELGEILERGRQGEEAVKVCAAALQLWPSCPAAHRLLARALLQLEHYPEAILSLDRYLAVSPPSAEVYHKRGQARAKLHQYAGALADYSRALDLEPNPEVFAARGWLYLLAFEAPRLALLDFEESLRRDAGNADAYNGRGNARVLLGQARAALADAEEALRCGPVDARLCYNAARIYAQAVVVEEEGEPGRPDRRETVRDRQSRAIELLRRAVLLCPVPQRSAFWDDYVRSDRAFGPIRRSPEFVQLAVEHSRKRR